MRRFFFIRLLPVILTFLPVIAEAQQRQLRVGLGTSLNVGQILVNVINYAAGAIVFISAAMFTVGALFITFSRGESDTVGRGKSMIIGSIIGMGVTLGSYAILRTVMYFIYV